MGLRAFPHSPSEIACPPPKPLVSAKEPVSACQFQTGKVRRITLHTREGAGGRSAGEVPEKLGEAFGFGGLLSNWKKGKGDEASGRRYSRVPSCKHSSTGDLRVYAVSYTLDYDNGSRTFPLNDTAML